MYQLQQQPQIKKRKSPARQEKVIARKQTEPPVPVRMDIPEMVQFRKFTAEQIITMAAELGLALNANTHQSFIRLLTDIDTSGWRWLLFFRPVERVRRLLRIAQRYGSIVTERDYEQDGAEAFLFLEYLGTNPLTAKDQQGAFGSVLSPNEYSDQLTERDLQSMMSVDQQADWMQQLQILLPISGKEGTKKAVEAALLYVNTGYVNSDMGNQPQCFIQSLQSITAFIQTAYQGMEEEDREGYWLVSTGSDRHMRGRHVLFLINKQNPNDRKVYKPRSVAIDDALIGKEGIFSEINARRTNEDSQIAQDSVADEREVPPDKPPRPHLATMQINEHSGRDNQPFGTEKYVTKKGTFTVKEARNYYFQMGVLEAAARFVGLTDLHQDNIMPTENGPLVIDAEVGLFFNETGLSMALTQPFNQLMEEAMANITITDEGPHEFSWEETNIFNQQYKAGKQAMEAKLAYLVQRPEFVQKFFDKTKNLRIRIVPVATNHLASWYQYCVRTNFDRAAFLGYMKDGDEYLSILGTLRKNIEGDQLDPKQRNPYFRAVGTKAIFPDPEIIPHLIFNAFCRHDVPLFELQLKNGEQAIYLLEGIPIGHTAVEFRYRNVLGG